MSKTVVFQHQVLQRGNGFISLVRTSRSTPHIPIMAVAMFKNSKAQSLICLSSAFLCFTKIFFIDFFITNFTNVNLMINQFRLETVLTQGFSVVIQIKANSNYHP